MAVDTPGGEGGGGEGAGGENIKTKTRDQENWNKSLKETVQITEQMQANYNSLNKELKSNSDIVDTLFKQKSRLIDKIDYEVEKTGEVTEEHVKAAKAIGLVLEKGQKYLEILPTLKDAQQSLNEQLQDASAEAEDLVDKLLGLTGSSRRLAEQQKKMARTIALTSARIKDMGLKSFLASKMQGIFAGLTMKAQEAVLTLAIHSVKMAFALDKATAEFKKQTGILDKEYTDAIVNTYDEFRQFGVSIENSANAQGALTQTFTDYTMLSKSERSTIMKTTAVFEAQGIAAQSTAEAFQVATKYLGETADAADETVREMVAFSRELSVAPEKMLKDFAAAGPQLAKFGDQAEKAFKELAVQSKETGMSVQRMLDIVAQFDTFEGAATAAGKLNAMLGGPFLGTLEMVAATNPAERFEMLRGALTDAGKDFESMGYYEKQAIANAMGLKDVGELALVMRDRTDLLSGATEKSAEEIEKEAEKAAQMQDVMSQLKDIFLSLAPVIIAILEPLKMLAEYLRENPKVAKALGYAIMTYLGARMLTSTARGIKGIVGGLKKSKTALDAAGKSTSMFGNTLKGMKTLLYIGAFTGLLMAIGALLDPGQGGGEGNLYALAGGIAAIMGVMVGLAAILMIPGMKVAFGVIVGGFYSMALGIGAVVAAVALLTGALSLLPEGVLNKIFGVEAAEPATTIKMEGANFEGLAKLSDVDFEAMGEGLETLVEPLNKVADASNKLNTAGLEAMASIPASMKMLSEDKVSQFVTILEKGAELNQPSTDTLLMTLKELVQEIQGTSDAVGAVARGVLGKQQKKLPDLIVKVDPREHSNLIKDVIWETVIG